MDSCSHINGSFMGPAGCFEPRQPRWAHRLILVGSILFGLQNDHPECHCLGVFFQNLSRIVCSNKYNLHAYQKQNGSGTD